MRRAFYLISDQVRNLWYYIKTPLLNPVEESPLLGMILVLLYFFGVFLISFKLQSFYDKLAEQAF